jgi:pyruvate kinase
MTILRGVEPLYFKAAGAKIELAPQIVDCLRHKAREDHISSILMTQLDSIEGMGEINACRLLSLNMTSHVKPAEDIAA